MSNVPEGARPAAPETDPLHEAMRHIDAAIRSVDRAFEVLLATPVDGAPTGVLIQAAAMLMSADAMLLRRALRARFPAALERA